MKKVALYIVISISLLGCGSDEARPGVKPGLPSAPPTNNPSTPPTKPTNPNETPSELNKELLSGYYQGLTGQGELANGLVDDNKRLWVIYSDENLYPDGDVLGFVNSNNRVVENNGEFEAKGKNYSYDARSALETTITGDYRTPKVIKGAVFGLPVNSTTYELLYDDKRSAKKQTLTSLNNRTFKGVSYITGDISAGTTTVKFTQSGNFSGFGEGCRLTGKMTLAASGKYFESVVTFGDYPCFAANQTLTGVALLDNNELVVVGTNSSKNQGLFFSSVE